MVLILSNVWEKLHCLKEVFSLKFLPSSWSPLKRLSASTESLLRDYTLMSYLAIFTFSDKRKDMFSQDLCSFKSISKPNYICTIWSFKATVQYKWGWERVEGLLCFYQKIKCLGRSYWYSLTIRLFNHTFLCSLAHFVTLKA